MFRNASAVAAVLSTMAVASCAPSLSVEGRANPDVAVTPKRILIVYHLHDWPNGIKVDQLDRALSNRLGACGIATTFVAAPQTYEKLTLEQQGALLFDVRQKEPFGADTRLFVSELQAEFFPGSKEDLNVTYLVEFQDVGRKAMAWKGAATLSSVTGATEAAEKAELLAQGIVDALAKDGILTSCQSHPVRGKV